MMGTMFGGRTQPTRPKLGPASSNARRRGRDGLRLGFGELWAETSCHDETAPWSPLPSWPSEVSDELAIHVPGALNHGCHREKIEEIMVQLTVYGGFPRAVEGMKAARAAFAKIDARR